jgi:multidrug efflux pump subunit AcrB
VEESSFAAWLLRRLATILAVLLGWSSGPDHVPVRPAFRVLAEWPGHGAVEVEQQVAVPLEIALAGLPGVERLRSVSTAGLGIVAVELARDADLDRAVGTAVDRLRSLDTLPPEVVPRIDRWTATGRAIRLVAIGGEMDPGTAVQEARERLQTVPGVAAVVLAGAPEPEAAVEIDAQRLIATGTRLDDVLSGLSETGLLGGLAAGLEELGKVVLRGGPTVVRLEDVAQVRLSAAPRRSLCVRGGRADLTCVGVIPRLGLDPDAFSAALTRRVAGLSGASGLGVELLSAPDLHVKVVLPPGLTMEQMARLAAEVSGTLSEVAVAAEHVLLRFDPAEGVAFPNDLDLFVALRPEGKASRLESFLKIAEALQGLAGVAPAYPEAPGAGVELGVQVSGPDLSALDSTAREAATAAGAVPGVAAVRLVGAGLEPSVIVEPDRERLARFGLSAADVDRTVQAARDGLPAGAVRVGGRRVAVRVRLGQRGQAPNQLGEAPVALPDGSAARLSELAAIRLDLAPQAILHLNASRAIGIRIFLPKPEPQLEERVRAAVAAAIQPPPGVQVEWGVDLSGL